MRMLICAAASLALVSAGALFMDWYRLTLDGVGAVNRVAIDLRSVHACGIDSQCVSRGLTRLPGMFPTLATVTLWSSLAFAVLVAFQAGARLFTGSAHDAFTKIGYMLALMAISLAVATAYLFGPEPQGVSLAVASRIVIALHRTWAPLTLIAGIAAGFAAIYLAVARESSDLEAAYKPVTIPPALALEARARRASFPFPVPPGEQTDFLLARPPGAAPREQTGTLRATQPSGTGPHGREQTGT
ncbi:MAG TPA: hypothetical protein VK607_18380, partial [Kofleriaceae bacterium]|nr:hypothetical protein [Kofleriaceae bacterium]